MIKNKDFDHIIFMLLILFFLFGVIMIYSASGYYAYRHLNLYPHYFAVKHLLFGIIGLGLALLINSVDLENSREFVRFFLLVTFILLVMVLIPGIGNKTSGASRWLKLPFVKIQPSEFAKLALIMFLANFIDKRRNSMDSFLEGFLPPIIIIGAFFMLIFLQPDFSTAMVIALISIIILFISGVRIKYLIGLFLVISIFAGFMIIHKPYRINRIKGWVLGEADQLGKGYHITRSKLAICTGGFFGKGLTHSEVKIAGLPEAHTDFIFSIMSEEIGLLGVSFIIFFYLVIIYRGVYIARKTQSIYLKFIAIGITLMIAIHTFFNIGVVTSILPPTGITLPFLSYGGSSLIVFMISIGMLMNISGKVQR